MDHTRLPRALALIVTLGVAAGACTDVRAYDGAWAGPRVGDAPELRAGLASDATATLQLDAIDRRGIAGRLSVDGIVDDAAIASVAGAEADALAELTFAGSPLRVYLAFAATTDGGGDALAMIALYDDDRVELRVLRGGDRPLYGVFALRRP